MVLEMQKIEIRSQKACGFTLTKRGKDLLLKINERVCDLSGKIDCYIQPEYADQNFKSVESTRAFFKKAFNEYDTIIAVLSTGIVVRSISDLMVHKSVDPGILVLDQSGKFVISLLSGHLGHANENARILGQAIGAQPVITTASDCQNVMAVDSYADQLNMYIKDFSTAKKVTSILVNGGRVGIIGFMEYSKFPSIKCQTYDFEKIDLEANNILEECDALIVDARLNLQITMALPTVFLYPKQMVLGIGMKRNTPVETLKREIIHYLKSYKISLDKVACFATIGLKRDEPALNKLSEEWNIKTKIVSDEEVKKVQDRFKGSDFVEKTTGLRAVAEPCGYIASDYGRPVAPISKNNGVTLSLWLINNE